MMRRVSLLLLLCLGASPAIASADGSPAAPLPGHPRSLTYLPLSISFPQPEEVRLSNGLLVYLFVDDELPLIDLAFYMKAGSIYDPPDKTGLSEIAMLLISTPENLARSERHREIAARLNDPRD